MKANTHSVHSRSFMDGIILNCGNTEVVYNDRTKTILKRRIYTYPNVFNHVPVLRGIVKAFRYCVMSVKSLNWTLVNMEYDLDKSDVNTSKTEEKILKNFDISLIHLIYFAALILGIIISALMFVFVPALIASLFTPIIKIGMVLSIIEGGCRLLMFYLFMKLTHLIPEIKRMYMYHGAEHKILNCVEFDKELNLENIKNEDKYYINCATYHFYNLAIIIILYFSFFSFNSSYIVNFVIRMLLLPLILGVMYEFKVIFQTRQKTVSKVGKIIQNLFIEEPTDEIVTSVVESIKNVKEIN